MNIIDDLPYNDSVLYGEDELLQENEHLTQRIVLLQEENERLERLFESV